MLRSVRKINKVHTNLKELYVSIALYEYAYREKIN